MSPASDHNRPTGARRAARVHGAFTLTELLIVIGIIVLVAILAVPVFRAMTGSRSTEAAQNQISAFFTRARDEALGVQEPRGVLFYRDLGTQRVGMAMVKPVNTAAPYELDLVADREQVLLPDGVGIQFIDNDSPPDGGPDADQYIGFNTRVTSTANTNATEVPYGGVVLFDRQGRLTTDTYSFRRRFADPDGPGPGIARASDLAKLLYNNAMLSPTAGALDQPLTPPPNASVGFVLFDNEAFTNTFREGLPDGVREDQDYQVDNRVTLGTKGANYPQISVPPNETEEELWLADNATPVLINRYNGTLLRGE